jgi:hypothetical protein
VITFSKQAAGWLLLGRRGLARRHPSSDGFLRGSSQIPAALRCFLSQTRDEKPHRNAKYTYVCATRYVLAAVARRHPVLARSRARCWNGHRRTDSNGNLVVNRDP